MLKVHAETVINIQGEEGMILEGSKNKINNITMSLDMLSSYSTVNFMVNVPTKGLYRMSVEAKRYTPDVASNPQLNVFINGTHNLKTEFVCETDYADFYIGYILLEEENVIGISLDNNNYFSLDYFSLERLKSYDEVRLLMVGINSETSILNTDAYTDAYSDMALYQTHAMVRKACITETPVTINVSGTYRMVMSAGSTQRRKYTISCLSDAFSNVITTSNFDASGGTWRYRDDEIGDIYLKEGTYTFKIDYDMLNASGGMRTRYFLLERIESDSEVLIEDFEFIDKCGYPAPNVLSDVNSIIASANITKLNNYFNDLSIVIAQYSSGQNLVNILINTVNSSELAIGEKHSLQYPFQLKPGYEDGYIKAFAWEQNSIRPCSDIIKLQEYVLFDSKVLHKTVQYESAAIYGYDGYDLYDDKYNIQAIFYDGSIVNGGDTKVFAYLGIPPNFQQQNLGAVVLVHGMLGTADIEWVKKWNDKGYAAISMDLYGNGPDRNKHVYGGVNPYSNLSFASSDSNSENAGIYHAVINVILANNILRNLPQVDKNKIGIVGFSWGGIASAITTGMDDRYSFASSIFGSGYLYKSNTFLKNMISDRNHPWDPSSFIKRAKMPYLWISSDHDGNFSLNSFSKSYELSSNGFMSIHPDLLNLNTAARDISEVYAFADSITKGAPKLIRIAEVTYLGNEAYVMCEIPENVGFSSATLFYNTDSELSYGGGNTKILWSKVSEYTAESNMLVFEVPIDAVRFYINITDSFGNLTSSRLIEKQR